ncbi:hypothetical protein ACGFWE_14375 [Streptomyces sp. NPDC048523]|uniref:hypothetical protein n=1 Tax=unclassified Streptomyces TaxID=2593676 RepID=UPI003320B515
MTGPLGSYAVLCHASWPVVAFTDAPPVPMRPVSGFVAPPVSVGAFATAGFEVLSPDVLSTPLSRLDLTGLTKADRSDIRYWRPDALADLLFNWWD